MAPMMVIICTQLALYNELVRQLWLLLYESK